MSQQKFGSKYVGDGEVCLPSCRWWICSYRIRLMPNIKIWQSSGCRQTGWTRTLRSLFRTSVHILDFGNITPEHLVLTQGVGGPCEEWHQGIHHVQGVPKYCSHFVHYIIYPNDIDLVYSFPKKFKRVCLSGHVTLRKFMEFDNILKNNFKKHNKCDFHQLKGID